MSVERDESGRRSVKVEVEVPGTPEEVWHAIATGPGVSSWFVPTEVDERVDGEIRCSFGPGMDSVSTIKVWDPPHRTVAESMDLGPDAPMVASEWTVEAKDGGTCIVRVVHSLFADSDDWDQELGAWEGGWPAFFRILRLYLTHFPGQPSAILDLTGMTALGPQEAWAALCTPLGLLDVKDGEQRRIDTEGLPAFDAHLEDASCAPHTGAALLRTSEPIPGLAHFFVMPMGEQTVLSLRFYVYGDAAAESVERARGPWERWIADHFPPPPQP